MRPEFGGRKTHMKETMSLDDIHQQDLEETIKRLTAEDVGRLQAHSSEFVELPCAACCGTELTFAFESQGFTYKRCRQCGLLMLSPAPDAARQLWYIKTSEALRFWRDCMPAAVRGSRQKMYDERARHVNDCFARYGTEVRRIVEVGAGNGEFAEALLRSNDAIDRMVLVEPQPLSMEFAQIEVVSCPVEKWATHERFDAAISWEVLEHLLEPDAMLCSIRE